MDATLAVRQAVRPWIERAQARILIGVSGGADSMALAFATLQESKKAGIDLVAIIVDHQLQASSAEVASSTKNELFRFGFETVEIKSVTVDIDDGLEASARRARYRAFDEAITIHRPDYFLLAHTKNDQAETVLLGLARGSGTRSLSGMATRSGKFIRPLLDVERKVTENLCNDNGIKVWQDPHNSDLHFARVRARLKVLPILEAQLGPGISSALARSAQILRQDADALDFLAGEYLATREPRDLVVQELFELPHAIRARVLRLAIYAAGAPDGSLSTEHLAPIEALVTQWHGQGAVSLPGGVKVSRISGRLSLSNQIS